MAFSLNGTTVTQTGTETPASLLTWATSNGLGFISGSADEKRLSLETGNSLHLDGKWNDTAWVFYMHGNSHATFGPNCEWTLGVQAYQSYKTWAEYNGPAMLGAVYKCNSRPSDRSWNTSNGGKLRWYGVVFEPPDGQELLYAGSRHDFILSGAGLDVQVYNMRYAKRGNHSLEISRSTHAKT